AFYSAMVALLTCLFTLFSATLGLIVFMVGSTFAFLICAMSYYQSAAADGSKKVYVLLVVYIANLIIVYLAGRIFVDSILAVAGLSLRTLNTLMNSYF
ncbi:MAG: hypothetical protein LIO37_01450, partial [Clostridiales bacterium]|nr:hypothetical protein [Clostridiales bacterium]